SAYRERLEQLDGELCEAEARHDLGAMDRLRREADFLITQLRDATQGRRAADHAERARLAVTKAVKERPPPAGGCPSAPGSAPPGDGAAGVLLRVHARPAYADRVVARMRTGARRRQILDERRASRCARACTAGNVGCVWRSQRWSRCTSRSREPAARPATAPARRSLPIADGHVPAAASSDAIAGRRAPNELPAPRRAPASG